MGVLIHRRVSSDTSLLYLQMETSAVKKFIDIAEQWHTILHCYTLGVWPSYVMCLSRIREATIWCSHSVSKSACHPVLSGKFAIFFLFPGTVTCKTCTHMKFGEDWAYLSAFVNVVSEVDANDGWRKIRGIRLHTEKLPLNCTLAKSKKIWYPSEPPESIPSHASLVTLHHIKRHT